MTINMVNYPNKKLTRCEKTFARLAILIKKLNRISFCEKKLMKELIEILLGEEEDQDDTQNALFLFKSYFKEKPLIFTEAGMICYFPTTKTKEFNI